MTYVLGSPIKNRIIILLTLTTFLFSALIKGHIKDHEENLLGEANITVEGTTLGSASDDKGYYLITGVEKGTYSMKCSYIGYHTITAVGVTVCDDSLTVVDFTLYPLEMEMEALEIEHEEDTLKDPIQFRKLSSIKFYRIYHVAGPDSTLKQPDEVKVGFFEKLFYNIGKIFD